MRSSQVTAARLASIFNVSVLFIVLYAYFKLTSMRVQFQSSSVYLVDDMSDIIETQNPDGSFSHVDESDSLTTWLVHGERTGDYASSSRTPGPSAGVLHANAPTPLASSSFQTPYRKSFVPTSHRSLPKVARGHRRSRFF